MTSHAADLARCLGTVLLASIYNPHIPQVSTFPQITTMTKSLSTNPANDVVIDGKKYNTFTEPPKAMAAERAKASFPVREMTYYLDGGEKVTEYNEAVWEQLERAPAFDNTDYYDVCGDHELLRARTLAKVGAIAEIVTDGRSERDIQKVLSFVSVIDPGAMTRIGVHFGLFLNGVRGSGTSEQFNYWVGEGAANLSNFFGCFCMTELGHGSNVAGVETTATFDRNTEEFVINTPTIAASKWWIGGAAHTATHGLVFARLIVDGKDYGVKNFVVPLRDRNTWNLMPGVSIGDIGKKMGRDGIDNGWVQFSNVRIPRLFMMMKYAKVSKDGKVTQPPLAQLAYGALISGRVSMVYDSYTWARRFLTIAIRYACCRRQFSSNPGELETKLIDYTFHQRRLLPRLAYAYAMNAGSAELYKIYFSATDRLASTKPTDKEGLQSAIDDVKELFSVSAGLKAFSTWGTAQIIDECRQACGGLGYSGYNGFGQGYNDWVVQCTWEGDNNVLTLSAGRSLIQSGLAIRKGEHVGAAASYLKRELNAKLNGRSLEDLNVLIDGWEHVSAVGISQAVDRYVELEKEGVSQTEAFERLSQQRYDVTRVHTRMYLIKSFFENLKTASPALQPVLTDLALLFALWSIETDASVFLRYGFLEPKDISTITVLVNKYTGKVREQAIPLTDAFNQSDFVINAPIGNYNGDVYNNYFAKTKAANPPINTHPPYYESVMKPFFTRKFNDDPDLSALEEEEAEENE